MTRVVSVRCVQAKGNILEKIGTDNYLKYDDAFGCTYYTMALIGCAGPGRTRKNHLQRHDVLSR